jgi:hypothetical protein
MTLIGPTVFIGIATSVLAVGSWVAAVYAIRAFRKQSTAVTDGQTMIGQQRDILRVQSDRLEVYRTQVDEQRQINAEYGKVLQLQVEEISASLKQRERDAEEQRQRQAAMVTAWIARSDAADTWEARIRNASDLPIFDVRAFFHKIHRIDPVPGGGNWVPVGQVATPPDEIICVLPPHTDRVVPIPQDARRVLGQLNDRTYVASIEFTDAAGNHWERDPRGALVPRS